jgi:hypothetical protein
MKATTGAGHCIVRPLQTLTTPPKKFDLTRVSKAPRPILRRDYPLIVNKIATCGLKKDAAVLNPEDGIGTDLQALGSIVWTPGEM